MSVLSYRDVNIIISETGPEGHMYIYGMLRLCSLHWIFLGLPNRYFIPKNVYVWAETIAQSEQRHCCPLCRCCFLLDSV